MTQETRLVAINLYLWIVSAVFLLDCHPWYSYFQYLTAWAWMLVKAYFGCSLYLERGLSAGCAQIGKRAVCRDVELTPRPSVKRMEEWCDVVGEVALCVSVIVVIMFWYLIWPDEAAVRCLWWEVNMHGVGLLLLLYERHRKRAQRRTHKFAPWRWTTQLWLWAFIALYTAIHVAAFFGRNQRPIYPGVDLTTYRGVILYASVAIALISIHCAAVLLQPFVGQPLLLVQTKKPITKPSQ